MTQTTKMAYFFKEKNPKKKHYNENNCEKMENFKEKKKFLKNDKMK